MTKFIPLGELIASYATSRGLNARELAGRCGLPTALVGGMLTSNGSYSTAVRAAASLGKKIKVTHHTPRKQLDAKHVQELYRALLCHVSKSAICARQSAGRYASFAAPDGRRGDRHDPRQPGRHAHQDARHRSGVAGRPLGVFLIGHSDAHTIATHAALLAKAEANEIPAADCTPITPPS
jgi:hypothetical protein